MIKCRHLAPLDQFMVLVAIHDKWHSPQFCYYTAVYQEDTWGVDWDAWLCKNTHGRKLQCKKGKRNSTAAGFEPTKTLSNRFQVCRLNHSAKQPGYSLIVKLLNNPYFVLGMLPVLEKNSSATYSDTLSFCQIITIVNSKSLQWLHYYKCCYVICCKMHHPQPKTARHIPNIMQLLTMQQNLLVTQPVHTLSLSAPPTHHCVPWHGKYVIYMSCLWK